MISRPVLSSIAFRLPAAIALICAVAFTLSAIAIYGLLKAREETAAYGLQAFTSLADAALVSRQVSDLVSSAPFLMNATSPYTVSGKSRLLVEQVDQLLSSLPDYPPGKETYRAANTRIFELLGQIRAQTLALSAKAETAQHYKEEVSSALGMIAVADTASQKEPRQRLNAIVHSVSSAGSLFQLGELKRRYVAEPAAASLPPSDLRPYERVFEAQTSYLLEMFAVRSAIARLHTVARELSLATETQSGIVTETLNRDFQSTSATLQQLLVIVAVASLLVLTMAVMSIRSVIRVSKGIVSLSSGMNALAKGQKDVGPPVYQGDETELLNLQQAFLAFKESVDRVTRLRRTAEAAARTIRSTFRSMNEGIAIFDAAGKPVTMNRRVIELLGHKGAARKLPLVQFLEPVPEIRTELLPGAPDGRPLSAPFSVRHRSENGSVTEISLSRQSDDGVVLLARDVTLLDRQEAEAAKAQRLDGIMRLTHQLSHEVGNTIGIITGSLGLLERDGGFSDRQARNIARIRKAADRGRSLASSMLTIGRQQPANLSRIGMSSLLRGMADILEIAIGEKCSLKLDLDDSLPPLVLDPELFEQSVLNLCLNSAAAMPDGGEVQVATFSNGDAVVVAVRDTGIGMSREEVDKAFEPYFTTKTSEGGAGLGLAVVYGFVRQSGGTANIFSEPGKGTTVELRFPQNVEEAGEVTPRIEVVS
ncbi:histidine kinase [Labrenzia sp. CP4]|jgi:signal transduction histidine kinase|uniref:sensor histidine kinase n=1 Tax=Stappiaceae TaxID=2821832 RepID=UPI000783AA22|nr:MULTISPECIES: ATP-binding protein [Stappiaceae]AMN51606.1 histidine kinase [Labrenzia sp. CP4]UFI03885.1 PAS domain-containing protein [Roseibium aggregatum]